MSDRKPSPTQLAALRAIAAGDTYSLVGPQFDAEPIHRISGKIAGARVQTLIERGWVREPARPYGDVGVLALTDIGVEVVSDATMLAAFEALPYAERPRVRVTERDLGRSPIRGLPGPGKGRNVVCYEDGCPAARRGERCIIWFTNESGADARYQAEVVAAKHGLSHLTPSE